MSNKHTLWLSQQLKGLRQDKVIDGVIEQKLRAYYQMDELASDNSSVSITTLILATIGGLLIGSGIILIFAHNWDNISRLQRTFLAVTPLIISQALCFIGLFPKQRGQAWREIACVLLFCTIPASIALIGQTYHISNDTQAFLSWWFVLALPMVYLMRANLTALLMTILATTLAINYNSPYWLCLFAMWPYYYQLRQSNSSAWSKQIMWVFVLCLALALPFSLFHRHNELISFFGMVCGALTFYLYGGNFEPRSHFWAKPLTNVGAIGLSIFGLILSFRDAWQGFIPHSQKNKATLKYIEEFSWHQSLLITILAVSAAVLFAISYKRKSYFLFPLGSLAILFLIPIALPFDAWSPIAFAIVVNLSLVSIGIWYVYLGVQDNSSSQLNFGLVMIMILLMCRFFDQDLSFIGRGIAFIVMGVALISINVWHNRRREAQ